MRDRTFLTAVLGLAVSLALVGCRREADEDEQPGSRETQESEGGEREVKLTAEAVERYGIRTERAAKAVLVPEFGVASRVAFDAETMADVGIPVTGRAREIRAKVGDAVKRGDVLVVVDSPELGEAQSEYVTKRREAETAAPAVEVAKSAYDRGKAFYDESRGITLTELQRREAEWRAAEATLANARTAARSAGDRLRLLGMSAEAVERLAKSEEIDPTYLVAAPIDGVVVERKVTLGELVGPDREQLMVLADMRTLWVLADVPETRLPEVAVGSRARLAVPALGGAKIQGSVSFLAPEVDAATHTMQVRIEVPGDAGLRPGMFAQAWIARGGPPPEPVLAVPEEAVQTIGGKTVVFVPSDMANEYRPVEVEVGEGVAGMVPILDGLKEGDTFVAAGSFVLKAEMAKPSTEED